MNRYEFTRNNDNLIFKLIKNGMLSYQLIRDCEIYERFIEMNEEINNEIKYITIGEEFELSHKRIEQIIYNMKKKIS